jgi:hypothetical protein
MVGASRAAPAGVGAGEEEDSLLLLFLEQVYALRVSFRMVFLFLFLSS